MLRMYIPHDICMEVSRFNAFCVIAHKWPKFPKVILLYFTCKLFLSEELI